MNVLIIDDSPTIREIVKIYLMNEGCTFVEAPDGEAGLTELAKGGFELVLADFKMPRLNGLGLLQKVRGDAKTAKLPVIILTGEKGPEVRESVLAAGATAVLNKPITAALLQAAVRKVKGA
jgi:two-component system chemotaxis response regulator CheY